MARPGSVLSLASLRHTIDFVEELGRISALQNIDIDPKVLNSLRLIEHCVHVQDVQVVWG